mgnify:CR=1 FL=1
MRWAAIPPQPDARREMRRVAIAHHADVREGLADAAQILRGERDGRGAERVLQPLRRVGPNGGGRYLVRVGDSVAAVGVSVITLLPLADIQNGPTRIGPRLTEIEITGMTSPYYDLERFGLHFVASPRHADCLLVTGPVTRNMAEPLRLTYEATPAPKIVIAVGDCARDCGVFKGSYAVAGSVADIIPVDVIVPGCPPEPADILRGILTAVDRLPHQAGPKQETK